MTTWYSEHYSADAVLVTGTTTGAITADNPPIKASGGISHAVRRTKRSFVDFSLGDTIPDASTCRMFPLRSSDRIYSLHTSAAAADWVAAADLDIGTYLAGDDRHTGALLDVDTFGANLDLGAGFVFIDHFTANGLEDEDRGKQLWELIEETATQGWLVDPILDIDIVIEFTQTLTTAGTILMVCEYTTGTSTT